MEYFPALSASVQPNISFGPNHIIADRALGDGSSPGARAYLQSLIDTIEPLGGGIIELLAGTTYLLTQPAAASEGGLRVKTANPRIWIKGPGRGRSTLKAAPGLGVAMTGIVRTTSGLAQRGLKVSGLTLDGTRNDQALDTVALYCGVSPNDPADVTVVGNTATLTYGAAHGRVVGQRIYVESWSQPLLRGDYIVATVPTSTTLTITVATGVLNETAVATYKTTFEVGAGAAVLADVSVSGGIATFTFGAAHGRTVGEQFWVNSPSQQAFRGWYFVATIPSATTLTVAVAAGIVSENNVQTHDTVAPNLYDQDIVVEDVEAMNCKKSGASGGYAFDPHEITRGFWIGNCDAHDNDGPALALDGVREFYAEVRCYRNQGAALECYTYARDGKAIVNGYENGNNLGGSPIASIGFEGRSQNIDLEAVVRDGKGNGLTIGFGCSAIRAKVTVVDHNHHGAHVRGGTDCEIEVTAIDCGQAADNTYDAVYLDNGQSGAGFPNARNQVRKVKVIRTKGNKLRYGVNIGAGASDNVVGPTLDIPYSAVGTGQIENAGTRTKLSTVRTAMGHQPGFKAARWYTPMRVGDNTTLQLVANRVYYALVWLPPAARINRQALQQTAGGSGAATVRFGLYASSKGEPSELLVDFGSISASTALGMKAINPPDIRVEGGWYWLAVVANGAATMPTVTAMGVDVNGPSAFLFGLAATPDLTDAALTPSGLYYDDAGATLVGAGLPAAALIAGPLVNSAVPVVFLEAG